MQLKFIYINAFYNLTSIIFKITFFVYISCLHFMGYNYKYTTNNTLGYTLLYLYLYYLHKY